MLFLERRVLIVKTAPSSLSLRRCSAVMAALSVLLLRPGASRADSTLPASALVRLHGYIPQAVTDAHRRGTRLDPKTTIEMALILPLRNKAGLDNFVERVCDPADPLYQHFLTLEKVTARFGPVQADYNAVGAFAKSKGLTVTQTWQNRNLVDVSAPASIVETAFGIHLMHYKDSTRRDFYASDSEPSVPANIAHCLQSIIGLDNAAQPHPLIKPGKRLPPRRSLTARWRESYYRFQQRDRAVSDRAY